MTQRRSTEVRIQIIQVPFWMPRPNGAGAARGACARPPTSLTRPAWLSVFRLVWRNSKALHVGLVSAGIAFYAFLSLVPMLGAVVMSYGIIADPAAVARHMQFVVELLPLDAASLINEQLYTLSATATDKKGLGLVIALALALFSASRASSVMIAALNIVYEQTNTRGLIRQWLLSLALIVAAMIIGITGIAAAALLAFAQDLFRNSGAAVGTLARILVWLTAAKLCYLGLGATYRFAPDRPDARWQWLSVGAVTGTFLWLTATLLFGLYAANFGNYDATYGSLGAVAVFLVWLYLSAYAVLAGALINIEVERQTARSSTTSPELMENRGGTIADTSAALEKAESKPS